MVTKLPAKKKREVSIVPMEMNNTELNDVMTQEVQRRQMILAYVKHHMKKEVDYGGIEITNKKTGYVTKTKPSLFKPGSEKFLSLFKLQARFKKDTDTWEMAGSYPGTFCYLCELFTTKGVKVGEGRGAARVDEKMSWTANNAIKIAQKRAQIDAVLRTGALSDFFTQDLEEERDTNGTLPKTYSVPRTVAADDDEAQGKRVQKEVPSDQKLKEKKMDIAKLLSDRHNYKMLGKKVEEVEAKVLLITGLKLEPTNYDAIIERLQAV